MLSTKAISRKDNFLAGMASVLMIFPRRYYFKLKPEEKKKRREIFFGELEDSRSLRNDWKNIGDDIYKALDQINKESELDINVNEIDLERLCKSLKELKKALKRIESNNRA